MPSSKQPKKLATPAKAKEQVAEVKAVPGRLIDKVTIENRALVLEGGEASMEAANGALASESGDFVTYAFLHLTTIMSASGKTDLTVETNAALAMIRGIAPRDELEAMLAAQMVATHHILMVTAGRTARADHVPQFDANGNMMTKFSRTFCAQMDALGKHRRGGEQVVRHVHVNDGGQAVIAGTFNHGTGGGVEQ